MNFSSRTDLTINSGLNDIFKTRDSQTISFAGGLPDPDLFPRQELAAAFQKVLTNDNLHVLQYAGKQFLPLREKLARKMQNEGLLTQPNEILLTQGAQQALSLIAQLLIDPGDGLVVEGPTYVGALAAFDAVEPNFYEVPLENDGLNLNVLEHVLKHHEVKMIYTIPDFQNPTGTVMTLAKRKALVELANRYDVMIVEDGAYRDLRYSGTQLPLIKQFDTQNRVIYVGSFSKILAPGMRLGWLVTTPQILSDLNALKSSCDIESSNLILQGVNQYLVDHDLDEHIAEIRQVYRHKKEVMYQALASAMPPTVKFNNPDGGFFIWLQLPPEFNVDDFLNSQLLPIQNVTLVPSKNLFASKKIQNQARLNFTGSTDHQIITGIRRLGQSLQECLNSNAVYF